MPCCVQGFDPTPFSKQAVHVWLCSALQTTLDDSSCVCCGRSLGPKEGVDVDAEVAWKSIQTRIKLDNHMQTNHPNLPWTPVSMAMVRDAEVQHELAQMLDANPDVQLNGPPFNSLASEPTSIVDKPWSAKVRKMMTYGKEGLEFWERITNQLLFLKHRDVDTMWSLLVRYTCSGLAANYSHICKVTHRLFSQTQQLDDAT